MARQRKNPDELNAKELIFCNEYIANGQNATQAYLKAYPSCKYDTARNKSSILIAKTNVRAYIDANLQEMIDESIADAKETMQIITALARGEISEEKPCFNPMQGGFEKIKVDTAPRDRAKAAELLAKRYSLLTDKHDITNDIVISVDIDDED